MSNIKVNETQIRVHIRYISPHYHALVSDEDATERAIFAASASLPAPVTKGFTPVHNKSKFCIFFVSSQDLQGKQYNKINFLL